MKGEEACKQVVIGVEMIFKEMKRLLNKYGLEELNLQKFDPNYCEAVSIIEREDIEEGEKIIEVLQKGYKFRGKLLRPAKVIVAIKKAKDIGCGFVILDDGFDKPFKKLNIVIDKKIKNPFVLPAGGYRFPRIALKYADIILEENKNFKRINWRKNNN